MPINKDELTKELVEKAVQCKDVNALITLAKAEGIDLTQGSVAGGGCYKDCVNINKSAS